MNIPKTFKKIHISSTTKNSKYYCELAVKMVMSELHWHTASPEDNNNSLKHDLLKSHNNNTAAVHMMQNRCKFLITVIRNGCNFMFLIKIYEKFRKAWDLLGILLKTLTDYSI